MPEQVLRATQLLARAFTETPPARNAFDVSQYAELRVDDAGHPEWAVPKGPSAKGPHVAAERIESDAERREVRDTAQARATAMKGIDWSRRYDVNLQPAMTYVDADGCGNLQVYGWTADRSEASTVYVQARQLEPLDVARDVPDRAPP